MGSFFDLCSFCQLLPRERKKQEYLEAVKNRYKHLPDVKRIVRFAFYAALVMYNLLEPKVDFFLKKKESSKFMKYCD